jgi:membrane protein DedA with SNARE-associated domain
MTGRAIRGHRLAQGSANFRARAEKVKRLIEVRPVATIVLLQYLYGLRLVGAVAFGLTELSLLRFALYQIVNCLVWAGLIGGVAYLLGGLVTEIFHGWFKWIWMVASAGLVVLSLRFVDRVLERIRA